MTVDKDKLAYDAPVYSSDLIVTDTPFTGNFSCTGYNGGTLTPGTGSVTVTHNLNKKCFPELLWSTDNVNFVPAPQENTNRLATVAACDTNTCTIYAYQSVGTSTVTVYYKLYLLWPN
jgi:hypothetical protein